MSVGEIQHFSWKLVGVTLISTILTPCIMCVQYRGDVMSTMGVSVRWGYHEYRAGISKVAWGCSVP